MVYTSLKSTLDSAGSINILWKNRMWIHQVNQECTVEPVHNLHLKAMVAKPYFEVLVRYW